MQLMDAGMCKHSICYIPYTSIDTSSSLTGRLREQASVFCPMEVCRAAIPAGWHSATTPTSSNHQIHQYVSVFACIEVPASPHSKLQHCNSYTTTMAIAKTEQSRVERQWRECNDKTHGPFLTILVAMERQMPELYDPDNPVHRDCMLRNILPIYDVACEQVSVCVTVTVCV